MIKIITILLALALFGCSGNDVTSPQPNPIDTTIVPIDTTIVPIDTTIVPIDTTQVKAIGKVQLRSTNISLRKTVSSAKYITEDIEAGVIRSSKAVFAIWNNVGTAPITNIKITTNNQNIKLSPEFITQLDIQGESSLTQIAEIDMFHGVDLGTKNYTKPLLPHGRSVTEIYFEGSSGGEIILDTFTIGYQAIYIDYNDRFTTTDSMSLTGDQNGMKFPAVTMSQTMAFEGDSCDAWDVNGDKIKAGDMIPFVILGQLSNMGDMPIRSDCVDRNRLPRELQ